MDTLRIIQEVDALISRLQQAKAILASTVIKTRPGLTETQTKHVMSAEGKARIVAAQAGLISQGAELPRTKCTNLRQPTTIPSLPTDREDSRASRNYRLTEESAYFLKLPQAIVCSCAKGAPPMKVHYKLTAMPTFPTEQFSGYLVTFVAVNIKARRTWTVYRSDLVDLFHQILTRVEAEKIVSDLQKDTMIHFAGTFTPAQLRPLGFLE